MQAIAIGLLLNLLFMQTPAGPRKTDRERSRLVGNVRSTLIEIATLSKEGDQPADGKRFGTSVTRYDEQGNIIERVQYDDKRIIARDIYTYDADGNFTKKQYLAQRSNPTGGPAPPAPNVFQCAVKYDSEGNIIKEACLSADAQASYKTEYKLDKANHRLETIKYAADGKVSSRCVETFGERGQTVEEDCRYEGPPGIAGRIRRSYTYEFDPTGNWVKRYSTSWLVDQDKPAIIGKDVVYRTISYDASKDVHPDSSARMVDEMPAGRPMIIRKSGGVLQQSATRRVTPAYPPAAKAAGVSGAVIVELTVDEAGKVIRTRVISGPAELRVVAEEAAKGWEFKPTTLSNIPVKVIGTITFNFNL